MAAKRMIDVGGSALMLPVLAPVLAVAMVASRVADGPGVVFAQERIGRNGRPFRCFKLRSMQGGDGDTPELTSLAIAERVDALKDAGDARTTAVGRVLRRFSIDELPQLINVLRGEMSLVGPRPLRDHEVDDLRPDQAIRQAMRPGITGSWQVMGRSLIHWDERIALDLEYVRTWTLRHDIALLLRTPGAVLSGRGAR
jgi:lipopolysaccharide/colanic/teichoic acid biosynthesis glycosyltransferase